MNPICPKCNIESELKDDSVLYGRSYGFVYICPTRGCDCFVGCHKGTTKPLGYMADKETRELRKKVHKIFDKIWKSGKMKRKEAYSWLSNQLNIEYEKTHVAMFDKELCLKALEVLK